MEGTLGAIIAIGAGGILAVFILLKICSTRPVLNTVLVIAAGVGLMITAFAMPVEKTYGQAHFDFEWVVGQAVCLFLVFVLTCAEFAFEEEEYIETKGHIDYNSGNYSETSKLATKSMFWGVLGTSLGATVVLVAINYAIFDSGIGLGILGAIITAFITFVTVKHWVARYRKAHGKTFY